MMAAGGYCAAGKSFAIFSATLMALLRVLRDAVDDGGHHLGHLRHVLGLALEAGELEPPAQEAQGARGPAPDVLHDPSRLSWVALAEAMACSSSALGSGPGAGSPLGGRQVVLLRLVEGEEVVGVLAGQGRGRLPRLSDQPVDLGAAGHRGPVGLEVLTHEGLEGLEVARVEHGPRALSVVRRPSVWTKGLSGSFTTVARAGRLRTASMNRPQASRRNPSYSPCRS